MLYIYIYIYIYIHVFIISTTSRQVSSNDYPNLEKLMKSVVKEKQKFVRLEMKIEDLCEMFKVS